MGSGFTGFGRRFAASVALTVAVLLLGAGAASAGWESGQEVDFQGEGSSGQSNGVWDGLAVVDGATGLTSAFFEQSVSGQAAYYAIRRGASDTPWSSPSAIGFPTGTAVMPNTPMAAAADSNGNAIDATVQSGKIFSSVWVSNAAAPSGYTTVLAEPKNSSLTDPQIAFDGAGNAYAVAGQPQDAAADEPIWLSAYSPSTGAWSSPAPITAGSKASRCSSTAGAVCGREPRLAVSRDGTIVVAYLACTARCSNPALAQVAVFAARRTTGGGSFFQPPAISSNPVPTTGPLGSPAPPNLDVAIDGSDTATIVDAESSNGGITSAIDATRWPAGGDPAREVQISSSAPVAPPASEPRVVAAGGGDATVGWTESTPNPSSVTLMSAELLGSSWSTPETVSSAADSPATEVTPFWLAEDPSGGAYATWSNGGSVQAGTRQAGHTWAAATTLSGGSSAVTGTVRVSSGSAGQADAVWVASNDSGRSAAYASRFTAPPPPPAGGPTPVAAPPAKKGPAAVPPAKKRKKARACALRPFSRIFSRRTHASRKGIVVLGSAGEHPCHGAAGASRRLDRVALVHVTIYHPAPHGRCRFVQRDGKLGPPRSCSRPIAWLAHGTSTWKLSLRLPLAPGQYLVRADAVDSRGHHQRRSAASVVLVIVR